MVLFEILLGVGLFLLVGNWVVNLIHLGLDLLLAPAFYARVNSIAFFGKEYKREYNEKKWKYSRDLEVKRVGHSVVFDINYAGKVDDNKVKKSEYILIILSSVIVLAISVVVMIIAFGAVKGLGDSELDGLIRCCLISISTGLVFHAAVHIIIALYSIYKAETSLAGYLQSAINKLRAGEPYENLNLKRQEDLEFKKTLDYEKILHFMLYFNYLDNAERFDELKPEVVNVETPLSKNRQKDKLSNHYIGAYYSLLYYYSYHEKFEYKANTYYDLISEIINKDRDANANRVLGFYYLNIKNDLDKAYEYANAAYKALNKMPCAGEKRYEEACVNRLFAEIDKAQQ